MPGLTNSKPNVTIRQFSGYRKIKSIYAETMLIFKVIWAWQPCETGMAAKDMQLLGQETKTLTIALR